MTQSMDDEVLDLGRATARLERAVEVLKEATSGYAAALAALERKLKQFSGRKPESED